MSKEKVIELSAEQAAIYGPIAKAVPIVGDMILKSWGKKKLEGKKNFQDQAVYIRTFPEVNPMNSVFERANFWSDNVVVILLLLYMNINSI